MTVEPAIRLASLAEVGEESVRAVAVAEHQRRFLSTPDIGGFLDDAHLHTDFRPFAIVEGEAVRGLVSVGRLPGEAARWWISLLVIDAAEQGRGLGRAAMRAVLDHVRVQEGAATAIGLSFHPENMAARKLYEGLGFEIRAESNADGEFEAWLRL